MTTDKPWREVVDLAEHYLAIGQDLVYLFDRSTSQDRPWDYMTEIKPGNSVRWDIRTNIDILAAHPCGVTFEWSVDIDRQNDDLSNTFEIDWNGLLWLLEHLPSRCRTMLRHHLRDTAKAMEKHAAEARLWVDREQRQADDLYRLSTTEATS